VTGQIGLMVDAVKASSKEPRPERQSVEWLGTGRQDPSVKLTHAANIEATPSRANEEENRH